MPATVIAGITGPKWGCTDEAYLFVNSMSLNIIREKSELKNGQSEFVQANWHSPKVTLTARGKVRTTSGLPGASLIGHIVAIADTEFSGNYYIDDITKWKTEGDWMEFEMTCSQYENPSTGNFTTTTT